MNARTLALVMTGFVAACATSSTKTPTPAATPPVESRVQGKLTFDNVERTFVLHVPPGYKAQTKMPLLVALHGYTGSAAGFEATSALNVVADREGLLVVYADGREYQDSGRAVRAWSSGGPFFDNVTQKSDDVGFINALLDWVASHYAVDERRVYIAGHSNGSMMAYRVGWELSCRIAAVVGHSGQMAYLPAGEPKCPVSLLHIHSLNDTVVAFESSADMSAPRPASVEVVLDYWSKHHDCSVTPSVHKVNEDLTLKNWDCQKDGRQIQLALAQYGAHNWLQEESSGVSANEVIWSFLRDKTLGDAK